MATITPAQKYLRAMSLGVWLWFALWFALCFALWSPASLAYAQASDLCGAEDDELLTPSAWCTMDRTRYLLANPAELITPVEWSEEHLSCRTLLEPFDSCVLESELVTPVEWL